MPTPAERVADYWATDHKADKPRSWLEHPVILRNVHRRITGSQLNGIEWFQRSYLVQPVSLALSLGCGLGGFERDALRMNIAERFHANDISPGAIETAKQKAMEMGLSERIDYNVMDLNEGKLPAAKYDVVFGLSSIHHVFQLERLFKEIRQSMKPNALLYLDEYIGSSRFQTAPKVTALINAIRATFPERLLYDLFANDGSSRPSYVVSPVSHFEINDPSEAVRSSEIVATLRMYFDVVEFRPYGGGLLHMLLNGIAGNFDENDEKDVALLNLLTTFEEALEDAGSIGSEFAVIVAKLR